MSIFAYFSSIILQVLGTIQGTILLKNRTCYCTTYIVHWKQEETLERNKTKFTHCTHINPVYKSSIWEGHELKSTRSCITIHLNCKMLAILLVYKFINAIQGKGINLMLQWIAVSRQTFNFNFKFQHNSVFV
jgi:hypothetical protein